MRRRKVPALVYTVPEKVSALLQLLRTNSCLNKIGRIVVRLSAVTHNYISDNGTGQLDEAPLVFDVSQFLAIHLPCEIGAHYSTS
jgi:hypothetical protein